MYSTCITLQAGLQEYYYSTSTPSCTTCAATATTTTATSTANEEGSQNTPHLFVKNSIHVPYLQKIILILPAEDYLDHKIVALAFE